MRNTLSSHRGFRILWGGQFVSDFGGALSSLAIPCAFILQFAATPAQVGLLEALGFASVPAFGLFAGILVDRCRRKQLMIVANVLRIGAVASLPIAWALHEASSLQFFIVAVLCGLGGVVFDTAYAAFLPHLVGREHLVEANAKMGASASVGELAGNSLAGVLVAAAGAPVAMLVNIGTYAFGTIQLIRMPGDDPRIDRSWAGRGARAIVAEMLEGFAAIRTRPALRSIAACSAISYLGGAMTMAVFFIFLFRDLHLSAALVGLTLGLSNVGVVSALFAGKVAKAIGPRRTLVSATLIAGFAKFVIPLAALGSPLLPIVVARVLITLSGPLYDVNGGALRAALVPVELQGRVAATMRTIVWGALPIGSLIGGYLGGSIGVVQTTLLGGAITAAASLCLLLCPRGAMRITPPIPVAVPAF